MEGTVLPETVVRFRERMDVRTSVEDNGLSSLSSRVDIFSNDYNRTVIIKKITLFVPSLRLAIELLTGNLLQLPCKNST
jgi:hypothetical protein